ncbi:MAG: MmgE/PrpD family protein [Chloroflexi bacterium]|nr:MmgE/PrpD family protein [Chloroflexota bacterium]
MDERSLTERLADFLIDTVSREVTAEDQAQAELYFLDWLGSAAAGTATTQGTIFLGWAGRQGGSGAEVVGSDAELAPASAAFVNGGLSHIVEMDDLDRRSVVHPGCVVFPAALAVAQNVRASGRSLLTAAIGGYEVAVRVGEAIGRSHYNRWHNTATCGVFGAAAAAGLLLGLQREQLVWAFGNAGSVAGGLWQFIQEGAMSKHWHAATAARCGVTAAELAESGFTGPKFILEGTRGIFASMSTDSQPQAITKDMDYRPWRPKMAGVSLKPYSSCRHTHSAVDAALRLRPRLALPHGQIASIRLDIYSEAIAIAGSADPQSGFEAKFSLPYCVACALAKGRLGLAEFEPPVVFDPDIRALMKRIVVSEDPELTALYPALWGAHLRIDECDGGSIEEEVMAPRGDPENPMLPEDVEAKFLSLLKGTALEAKAGQLIEKCRSVHEGGVDRDFLRG